MRVRPIFAWYDLWVGAYWDRTRRRLYLLPVPMLGVVIEFGRRLGLSGAGVVMMAEPCNAGSCPVTVTRRDGQRCGGVLFGTRDHAGGCGLFFCDGHLVGRRGPFYCDPCWEVCKQVEAGR